MSYTYDALQISPLPTKNIKVIRKCLTRRTQKSIHRQHIIFFDWVEYTHRKRAPPLTGNASLSKLDTVNFLNRELNKFSHCLRWREVMEGRTQSYIIAAISYRYRQTYSVQSLLACYAITLLFLNLQFNAYKIKRKTKNIEQRRNIEEQNKINESRKPSSCSPMRESNPRPLALSYQRIGQRFALKPTNQVNNKKIRESKTKFCNSA